MSFFPRKTEMAQREERGFTLVEVLVALSIAGFLAISVLAAVSQQGRLTRLQGSREEVQQNVRGAIELLASEVRSLPQQGLVHADANRIVLRVPRATGLLCTTSVPNSGSIHMLVSTRAWSRTAPDTLSVAVRFTSSDTTGAFQPGYTTMDRLQVETQASIVTPCSALNPGGDVRMLTLTPVPSTSVYPSAMRTASAPADMYLYEDTEYAIGTTTVPGQWINRTSRGSTRPLAGPLPASGTPGLRFRYFVGDQELTALPVTDPATLSTVNRISVEVTTVSRQAAGSGMPAASRRLVTDVYLRNNGDAS
jgi:prepilin-type N-terminal cleavage/methylation domain-containing protein